MLIKLVIVALLLAILVVLFRGLFFLAKDQGQGKRVATSLTWRVALSALLIIVLVLAIYSGQLQPHGVGG